MHAYAYTDFLDKSSFMRAGIATIYRLACTWINKTDPVTVSEINTEQHLLAYSNS